MDLTNQPITLPLDAGINRCLAHGANRLDWCEKRATCACHETIKHDAGINAPAAYRKCSTDAYACYLPLHGFAESALEA